VRHLVCLGLFLAGVFSFGCKVAPRSANNNPPVPPLPGERSPGRKEDSFGPAGPVKRTAGATGLLAGVVLDRFDRKIGNAAILLYSAGEGEAAPVKIWADKDGYFTIPNLEVGASYRLTAVVEDGDRKLTGTTFARPPDPRLLIRLSEDLVTPDTPDVPKVPALKEPDKGKPPQQGEKKPAARLEIPRTPSQGEAAPAGTQPLDRPNRPRRDLSRTLEIPRPPTGSTSQAAPIKLDLTGGTRPPPSTPSGVPTPIPSCLMDGNRLLNLALFDENGQGWEWKQHRRGRLVLLDFWYTECRPCLAAIPKLNQLQQRYGEAGLEVIGIACERADTSAEMASKVQRARRQFDIRYRTLLSTTARKGSCPVCSHFGIEYYPTLFLIDEQGNVVYRSVGWNPELEREIQRRLP